MISPLFHILPTKTFIEKLRERVSFCPRLSCSAFNCFLSLLEADYCHYLYDSQTRIGLFMNHIASKQMCRELGKPCGCCWISFPVKTSQNKKELEKINRDFYLRVLFNTLFFI